MVTRRRVLATTGVAAVVAGAGAAGWLTTPKHRVTVPAPPRHDAVLQAELVRERLLLQRLDDAARATPALATRIAALRPDHVQHVTAIEALLRAEGVDPAAPTSPATAPATGTATATSTPPPAGPASVADLVAAEHSAAQAAAAAALLSTGATAATLASVAACEASHVGWLS